METNTEFTTCKGCLSTDRRLSLVLDSQILVYEFLFNIPWTANIMLCWECIHLIKKITDYRCQVKFAQELLYQYSQSIIQPDSLTRLSLVKIDASTEYNFDHDSASITEANEPLYIKLENENHDYDDVSVEFEYKYTGIQSGIENPENQKETTDSDDEPLSKKPKYQEVKKNDEEEEVRSAKKRVRKKQAPSSQPVKRGRPASKTSPGELKLGNRTNKKLSELNIGDGQVKLVMLSLDEVQTERRKLLENEPFKSLEYKCYDCIMGFNHKIKLDNHMKKHCDEAGNEVCPVCKVRCRSKKLLDAHLKRHQLRWSCSVCDALSSRAPVAADHVRRAHGGVAPTHLCGVCGLVAQTYGKLRVHLKEHAERVKCEICQKTFKDRASLNTHLFIHKGEKEYSCPKCSKQFLFKKAMEIHMVTHSDPENLYCYECDMTFKNKISFYAHNKYSLKHIDPAKLKHACKLCDKRFTNAIRLEEHNSAIHLKITPLKCEVPGCSFTGASRSTLRSHARSRHLGAVRKRDRVCHLCGKAYSSKKALDGHVRSHTGARPFRCAHCAAAFGYEAALYNHCKLLHNRGKIVGT